MYFDLFSKARQRALTPQMEAVSQGQLAWWRQAIIWFGLAVGIAIKPIFPNIYSVAEADLIALVQWPRLVLALIVGLIVFPAAYKNALSAEQPLLAQFGVAITFGIGWRTIVDGVSGAPNLPLT